MAASSVGLTVVLCYASAVAADVHVGPSASGTGSGIDWNHRAAWSTVTLVRGETYFLADGSYGSKVLDTPVSGSTMIHIRKATPSAHGSTAGWQDSDGDGVAEFPTASLVVSTSYWNIDGVTGGGPGSWKTGHGIVFSSDAGTEVSYIDIAPGVSDLQVRHCAFTQAGDTTAFGVLTNAFYAPGSLSNALIEYCYIDNLGGLPFFFRGGTTNIIQYSYTGDICGASAFDENQHCEALVLHNMGDVHFRWNYVAECPSSGGLVKNDVEESTGVRIYGNVFETGFPIQCNTGTCTDWRIINNTFHSVVGGPLGGDGTVNGLLYYNNLTFDSVIGSGVFGTHESNWFSQIAGLSCATGANSTENITVRYPDDCDVALETLDPFVASAGDLPEDFLLASAIDGWPGTDVCALETCAGENRYDLDAFGSTRGSDGTWDRGAYEYPPGSTCDHDGTCDAGEDHVSCPADCPASDPCGNGTCDAGEDHATCPADCPAPDPCGNGTCDTGESHATCPADCPAPDPCGNGTCDTGEDHATCPVDCQPVPASEGCSCNGHGRPGAGSFPLLVLLLLLGLVRSFQTLADGWATLVVMRIRRRFVATVRIRRLDAPGLVAPGLVEPRLVAPRLVAPRLVAPGLVALGLVALLTACGSGRIHDIRVDGAVADALSPADGAAGADAAPGADASPGSDASPGADASPDPDGAITPDAQTGTVVPPLGGSSGGSGGGVLPSGQWQSVGGVSYLLIVPSGYSPATASRCMIVYSGTEGAQTMKQNLLSAGPSMGLGDVIFAVLDGVTYNGNGAAGAAVLDDVRARYNVDNDRTYLLSESAGTTAGLQLGLQLRQSYFAAYWANDVNAQANPAQTAAQLGFAPWGNAGPGGDFVDASAIVSGMLGAGYRLPADAPYSGAGADTHGSTQQFLAALQFYAGKSRL